MRGPDTLLVVEIADTSLGCDLGEKADLYCVHGVREYWVLDSEARVTHRHLLEADGTWRKPPSSAFSDSLAPTLIQGVSVRISELI